MPVRLLPYLVALFAAAVPLRHADAQAPTWTIINGSNQTLAFETLDPARGTWKKQSAYPNQRKTFRIASGLGSSSIRIATQGRGYVRYKLNAGGTYRISWNGGKGVWDVVTVRRAASAAAAPPRAASGGQRGWQLHNSSNSKLDFQTLDPARGTWRNQSIYPNQTKRYTVSPGASGGKIRIATKGRGTVQYSVLAGRRYAVIWNARSGVWDVRTLR